MSGIIGWDIGGAHVKAVQINARGQAVHIWHRVAPLWRGLHRLTDSISAIRKETEEGPFEHAVTMSGELSDIFPTRSEGVRQISESLQRTLGTEPIYYFSSKTGFIEHSEPQAHTIGSMNWYASAQLAARLIRDGVFVDVGSTTTDLIQIQNHQTEAMGFTDSERLVTQELLYTGVVRTALMSLAPRIQVEGRSNNIIAERFASTADVYNLLGLLPESFYPFETADGNGCSAFESARRVARMIGRDCEEGEALDEWVHLAKIFAQEQKTRIAESLKTVNTKGVDTLIGTGTGRFLLPEVAKQCGMEFYDINTLLDTRALTTGPFTLADCLPAYAVAELFRRSHADR